VKEVGHHAQRDQRQQMAGVDRIRRGPRPTEGPAEAGGSRRDKGNDRETIEQSRGGVLGAAQIDRESHAV
jgi:hypothetical protein